MAMSEGGWPVGSPTALGLVHPDVDGVTFPGGVAPYAAELLMYVARRFHNEVEPLRAGWCWCYAFRPVRKDDDTDQPDTDQPDTACDGLEHEDAILPGTLAEREIYSDHAGGAALDLNAPDHPRGRRGTFTPEQERAIRAILADINRDARVIAWGEDFPVPDGMHFALRGGFNAVAAATTRLTGDWFDMATKRELREVVREVVRSELDSQAGALGRRIAEEVWGTVVVDPVSGKERTMRTIVRYGGARTRKAANDVKAFIKASGMPTPKPTEVDEGDPMDDEKGR